MEPAPSSPTSPRPRIPQREAANILGAHARVLAGFGANTLSTALRAMEPAWPSTSRRFHLMNQGTHLATQIGERFNAKLAQELTIGDEIEEATLHAMLHEIDKNYILAVAEEFNRILHLLPRSQEKPS